jgi:hypothetical protein
LSEVRIRVHNKADHFVVMPQTGWEPAELRLEIKRRLGV